MDEKETQSCTKTHVCPKFTALRLDLRRVIPRRHSSCRHQVFVISDRMTTVDLKKSIAEKNSLDETLVHRWHLVASVERGDRKWKFLIPDDQFPLTVADHFPDCSVRFSLKWKKRMKSNDHETLKERTETRTSGDRERNEENSQEHPEISQHSSSFASNKAPTDISSENGFKMAAETPEVTERRLGDDVIRNIRKSGGNDNECIIHYEPNELQMLKQNDRMNRITHSNALSGSNARDISHHSHTVPPSSLNGGTNLARSTDSQKHGAFRVPQSISETPDRCVPPDTTDQKPENGSSNPDRRVNAESNDSSGPGDDKDTFCPIEIRGSFKDVGRTDDSSTSTSGSNVTSAPATLDPCDAVLAGEHRESKFSSLPNMEELEVRGGRGRTSLERTPSSNSLPCVRNSRDKTGLRGGGRRCLPQLQVPEAIVEEKRSALSLKLQEKLQSFRKRKKKRRHRREIKRGIGSGSEHVPDGSRTKTSGDDSDDCMSVTSWEVAEILATAEPMAPQDSDYEESDSSRDEEEEEEKDDNDRLVSDLKVCRISGSGSDADTLDGSWSEEISSAKEFSPIGSDRRRNRKELANRKHHSISQTIDSAVKPASIQAATHVPPSTVPSTVPRVQQMKTTCSNTGSSKVPSLFRLLSGSQFRCRTSVLSAKSSTKKNTGSLPFEVFNDVIYLSGAGHLLPGKAKLTRDKFIVPVIGESSDSMDQWECLEGKLESGDIIIEVNGKLILQESASVIVRTCLEFSDNLQLLLARQRTSH